MTLFKLQVASPDGMKFEGEVRQLSVRGICGELAADLRLTQRFADMEIDELSVSVPYLLALRQRITECK